MKTIDTGGPAFPEHHYFDPGRGQYGQHMTASDVGCGGMTLRAWLAGQCIGPLIASDGFEKRVILDLGFPISDLPKIAAETACQIADAMISELKKGQLQ